MLCPVQPLISALHQSFLSTTPHPCKPHCTTFAHHPATILQSVLLSTGCKATQCTVNPAFTAVITHTRKLHVPPCVTQGPYQPINHKLHRQNPDPPQHIPRDPRLEWHPALKSPQELCTGCVCIRYRVCRSWQPAMLSQVSSIPQPLQCAVGHFRAVHQPQ